MNKVILSIAVAALILTTGFVSTASAANTNKNNTAIVSKERFSDVKGHWSYRTIMWAVDNKIVEGYSDGTFKPDRNVSEAEFLVMFIRAFNAKPVTAAEMNHWADAYYNYAISKKYPVRGTKDKDVRNGFINREYVAEIIAAANGVNFVGKNAIQYLLNKEFSKGKTVATVAGYKGEDLLTRSETIQFIKNLKDQGMKELKDKPELTTPIEHMPPVKSVLPKNIQTVKDKMEKFLASSPDYAKYSVLADETGVTVAEGKRTIVSYDLAQTQGGTDGVVLFEATSDALIKLAVDMLQTAGIAVPDSFSVTIKQAVISGHKSTHTIGTRNVTVWPHPTNADYVSIDYIR
ncbi:S-layer homology domain-containing protein [Cohnella abietis]|uniref:SLH domain-containing protein n=1 Tax=Cohnella abietis TaxID=2507935 RepID=A0A3T1CY42_9BACL|nr:S-layer homology domain-containing protein [Cohnella abietis]BBI30750.1 hypothetical protein KCTCHS21_01490 [Cohnella abietis]